MPAVVLNNIRNFKLLWMQCLVVHMVCSKSDTKVGEPKLHSFFLSSVYESFLGQRLAVCISPLR